MESQIIDPEDFPYEYNKEIFEAMSKNFVPIDTTELYKEVPKNDKILCSMIAFGTRMESDKYKIKSWSWSSHVLLTKFGMAFKNYLNQEAFYYWNEIKPKASSGKEKKYKLNVRGNNLEAGSPIEILKGLIGDSQEPGQALREYFTVFCKMLHTNYLGFIKEMKACTKKIEMISKRIEYKGFEQFIKDCRTLKFSGLSKQALKIAQNMEELVDEYDEIKLYDVLQFQAECYFWKSKISKAIEILDKMLKLYPNDKNILELKEKAQKMQTPNRKTQTEQRRISKQKEEKYRMDMEKSKQELEQIELIKEKELIDELERIQELIEEKQYLIVKDKLEIIIHESKKFHLNTILTNAQAEYNKYKIFWE